MNDPMPMPDWNHIRAFLTTVEQGSLSAAARTLGLTQPTLSRQVAALEADLGVLLFERIGRSLSLTGAGQELLVSVRAMGQAAHGLSLAASGQSQSVDGLVRIAAMDVIATYVLPDVFKRLQKLAPKLQIEIVASNSISDLMRREADIAIRHIAPAQPELISHQCPDFSAHLYAATSYLDRYGRPTDFADVRDARFIGFANAGDLLPELTARGLPVTSDNFGWQTSSAAIAWQLVREGLGIGLMGKMIADRTPDVEMVLPTFTPIPAPIWLTTHRELHTSRRIRLVFDVLVEMLG
jgi:DNA-binding transcriptional LysR family regulator